MATKLDIFILSLVFVSQATVGFWRDLPSLCRCVERSQCLVQLRHYNDKCGDKEECCLVTLGDIEWFAGARERCETLHHGASCMYKEHCNGQVLESGWCESDHVCCMEMEVDSDSHDYSCSDYGRDTGHNGTCVHMSECSMYDSIPYTVCPNQDDVCCFSEGDDWWGSGSESGFDMQCEDYTTLNINTSCVQRSECPDDDMVIPYTTCSGKDEVCCINENEGESYGCKEIFQDSAVCAEQCSGSSMPYYDAECPEDNEICCVYQGTSWTPDFSPTPVLPHCSTRNGKCKRQCPAGSLVDSFARCNNNKLCCYFDDSPDTTVPTTTTGYPIDYCEEVLSDHICVHPRGCPPTKEAVYSACRNSTEVCCKFNDVEQACKEIGGVCRDLYKITQSASISCLDGEIYLGVSMCGSRGTSACCLREDASSTSTTALVPTADYCEDIFSTRLCVIPQGCPNTHHRIEGACQNQREVCCQFKDVEQACRERGGTCRRASSSSLSVQVCRSGEVNLGVAMCRNRAVCCYANLTDTTSSTTVPATTASSMSVGIEEPGQKRTGSLGTGAIAGISVGVIIVLAVLIAVVVFMYMRSRRRSTQTKYKDDTDPAVYNNFREQPMTHAGPQTLTNAVSNPTYSANEPENIYQEIPGQYEMAGQYEYETPQYEAAVEARGSVDADGANDSLYNDPDLIISNPKQNVYQTLTGARADPSDIYLGLDGTLDGHSEPLTGQT